MYTLSFYSPFKKAMKMFIYLRIHLYLAANAKIAQIVDHLTTGAKISKKSTPFIHWKLKQLI
jgi:hypothetical protein